MFLEVILYLLFQLHHKFYQATAFQESSRFHNLLWRPLHQDQSQDLFGNIADFVHHIGSLINSLNLSKILVLTFVRPNWESVFWNFFDETPKLKRSRNSSTMTIFLDSIWEIFVNSKKIVVDTLRAYFEYSNNSKIFRNQSRFFDLIQTVKINCDWIWITSASQIF